MPLPKAPSRPADILEDYGPQAVPEAKRSPAKAAAAAPATEKPKRAKSSASKAKSPAPEKTTTAKRATKAAAKKPAAQSAALMTAAPSPEAPAPEKAGPAVKTKAAPQQAAASKTKKGSATARAAKGRVRASERRGRAVTPDLPKIFVLDTNVLMHDPLSLFRFAEHDVFLPMTTLEELDNHKKGLTDVARNARTVSRTIDQLLEANGGRLEEGLPLSLLGNTEASGRLWFETQAISGDLPEALPSFKGDNRILATVKGLAARFPKRAAVLVTKDINMRIKAAALGIPAEDYFSDKVLDDTDMIYSGRLTLEADFWSKVSSSLKSWQEDGSTYYRFESDDPARFTMNACLTIEGDPDFMGMVTAKDGPFTTIRLMKDYRTTARQKVWGIHARNAEQNMALNLLLNPEIDFLTILGQAGTGKTLLTLAAALAQTIDERRFTEIIVTRATVSVGEDIGFLPGTEEEKMAPWMGALEDNLEVLHRSDSGGDWGRQATLDIIKSRIRVKSMSFMRGRTFLEKFVIIDEAQNLSPKQMKTLITRAGPGTKIVCLGNISQIDTPYLTEGSSGLTYVVERFLGWPHAATITLTRGERSRLAEFAAEAL